MAFCPYCGAPLSEDSQYCMSCGASIAAATQPQQPQPQQPQPQQPPQPQPQQPPRPQQAQAPQPPASSPAGKNYEKLGGWLLFFVILYGISAAIGLYRLVETLGTVISMHRYLGGLAGPVFCDALTNLVSVVADVAYIVLILKKHPTFLQLFQKIRIACIGASVLLTIIAGVTYGGAYAAYIAQAGGLLVSGGVGIVLMTLYFCKSVRVRVYMGTTEYLDTALFKIGA